MESIEVRFLRNRAAKKNAKDRIFGIIWSSIKMESIEVRFLRNRAAKKNAKDGIFGIIWSSIGQISYIKLALLRKVYCHKYEEMLDMIEHEISQLMKKQTLLYSLFRELELERIKLPSILNMDSEVSKRLYRMLCIKAEKKVKIIEEIFQKGENEETVMAEIRKLDEEKDRLVASQCEMIEKRMLEPQM